MHRLGAPIVVLPMQVFTHDREPALVSRARAVNPKPAELPQDSPDRGEKNVALQKDCCRWPVCTPGRARWL